MTEIDAAYRNVLAQLPAHDIKEIEWLTRPRHVLPAAKTRRPADIIPAHLDIGPAFSKLHAVCNKENSMKTQLALPLRCCFLPPWDKLEELFC